MPIWRRAGRAFRRGADNVESSVVEGRAERKCRRFSLGMASGASHDGAMATCIPASERIGGVYYATTRNGIKLPVIDVTHPSFAMDSSDAAVRTLRERGREEIARWSRRPAWISRLMLFLFARRSAMLRAVRSSKGGFLSGMNTYLVKLPPGHLASSFATAADRRIARGAQLAGIRLRLQIMSELLAEQLARDLTRAPAGAPIFLLNVAGGPAMDSLNALLLARRQAPAALAGHPVRIEVLDLHDEAPAFGRRALDALGAAGAPLAPLDIGFRHEPYDWNQPESLRGILRGQADGAVGLGSSEGGLFSYAGDEVIRANLEVLRAGTGRDFTFTGTYSPEHPLTRAALRFSRAASRFFAPEAFARLVRAAGWRIDRDIEAVGTRCVRLAKA